MDVDRVTRLWEDGEGVLTLLLPLRQVDVRDLEEFKIAHVPVLLDDSLVLRNLTWL